MLCELGLKPLTSVLLVDTMVCRRNVWFQVQMFPEVSFVLLAGWFSRLPRAPQESSGDVLLHGEDAGQHAGRL